MHFKDDHSVKEWDLLLAQLGGHPLQSALWGEAKKTVYGVSDKRIAIYNEDKLNALIRIENRGLRSFLKLAWIQCGPTIASDGNWETIKNIFLKQVKDNGHSLCAFSPWKPVFSNELGSKQTIWIDLQIGKDKLLS